MGMLSYEDRSDTALAFIYEIFVLPRFRKQGVAAMLLSHAERFAIGRRCEVVRLEPRPLDETPEISQLESWYARAGYRRSSQHPELMEKSLPISSAA
jgi:GNAT superfamily N-acetyltransferase